MYQTYEAKDPNPAWLREQMSNGAMLGGGETRKAPPAQLQLDILHKTVADLGEAVSTLEARLGSVLPPSPTVAGAGANGIGSGVGGGSPLYCQLHTLTERAQQIAAQVRYIGDRAEV